MNIEQAYDVWSEQYDANKNRTRDLEGAALRSVLGGMVFENCLEIGCGTGKNTVWLSTKSGSVLGIDLSAAMLAKAKDKGPFENVQFRQADILRDWDFFEVRHYDLIVFSLVLEHIEDLDLVFKKAAQAATTGGYVYVGELHPFKQYGGTKARFETPEGIQVLNCFTHHVSDFTGAAKRNGLEILEVGEYFDDGARLGAPRILALLLRKK